jgi:hypothetical protein
MVEHMVVTVKGHSLIGPWLHGHIHLIKKNMHMFPKEQNMNTIGVFASSGPTKYSIQGRTPSYVSFMQDWTVKTARLTRNK